MIKRITIGFIPLAVTMFHLAVVSLIGVLYGEQPLVAFKVPGFCFSVIFMFITSIYLMVLGGYTYEKWPTCLAVFWFVLASGGSLFGIHSTGTYEDIDKPFRFFCLFFVPAIQLSNNLVYMVIDDQ